MINTYLKINKQIEKFEKIIAVVIISLIVLIVFVGTISRYVFKEPFYGSDRLATYLMVWLGFIGFQIATAKLRHIEIEFIKNKVSSNVKCKMNITTCLIACIFLFIIFLLSLEYMNESRLLGDTDIVLDVPLWIIIMVMPFSFLISSIRYFFSSLLWYDVLKGRRNEEDIVKKQLL